MTTSVPFGPFVTYCVLRYQRRATNHDDRDRTDLDSALRQLPGTPTTHPWKLTISCAPWFWCPAYKEEIFTGDLAAARVGDAHRWFCIPCNSPRVHADDISDYEREHTS
jgi:hypothetical protein